MEMSHYFYSWIGGVCIGLSAVLLMAFNGKIAGVSGMIHDLIPKGGRPVWPNIIFLIGIVVGSTFYYALPSIHFLRLETFSLSHLWLGGILVGLGTRLGSGCTSGHGVCGLARLSKRSLVATCTFMISGMLTVFLTHHL